MRGTFLFVPVLCAEGSGTVRILSGTEARLEFANLCTWLGPTSYWKLDGVLDRVDLGEGVLGFSYSLKGGGVPVVGGGSGYLLAKIGADEADETEKRPEPKAKLPAVPLPSIPVPPLPSLPPVPESIEAMEELASAPVATLAAKLKDAGGDSVIDAGEAFTLSVELTNVSPVAAKNVRLLVSGSPALTSVLGTERILGDLPAGQQTASEVKGTLPPTTPSQTATKSDLEAYLTDWLPRRVNERSRVFVYFAGHGSPAGARPSSSTATRRRRSIPQSGSPASAWPSASRAPRPSRPTPHRSRSRPPGPLARARLPARVRRSLGSA